MNFTSLIALISNPFIPFLLVLLQFRPSLLPPISPNGTSFYSRDSPQSITLCCTSLKSFICFLSATGSGLNSLGCHKNPFLICPPCPIPPFLNSPWILFVANWLSRVSFTEIILESLGRQPTTLDHIIFGGDFFSVRKKKTNKKPLAQNSDKQGISLNTSINLRRSCDLLSCPALARRQHPPAT